MPSRIQLLFVYFAENFAMYSQCFVVLCSGTRDEPLRTSAWEAVCLFLLIFGQGRGLLQIFPRMYRTWVKLSPSFSTATNIYVP